MPTKAAANMAPMSGEPPVAPASASKSRAILSKIHVQIFDQIDSVGGGAGPLLAARYAGSCKMRFAAAAASMGGFDADPAATSSRASCRSDDAIERKRAARSDGLRRRRASFRLA